MKFECPNCKNTGQVDDSKVPEAGVFAKCPQCNNKFLVKHETPKNFEFETVKPTLQQTSLHTTAPQIPSSCEPSMQKTTVSVDTDDLAYYKVAIGKNFEKYVNVIISIQGGNDNPTSWHWPAFFVGIPWAFYRKMYKIGFTYFFIVILLSILSNILKTGLISFIISIGVTVAFAVYAKSFYAKHIKDKITSNSQLSHSELINELTGVGGTNAWVPYLGLIPIAGIIAAIAIPQFSNRHNTNSSVPQSSTSTTTIQVPAQTITSAPSIDSIANRGALSDLKNVCTGIEAYYADHQSYPGTLPPNELLNLIDARVLPETIINYIASIDSNSNKYVEYSISAYNINGDSIFTTKSNPNIVSLTYLRKLKSENNNAYKPI